MFTSDIIKKALWEDIGEGDRTTRSIVPKDLPAAGEMVAKQDLVVAGLGVAGGVFSMSDASLKITQLKRDGDLVSEGDVLMEVSGNSHSLLAAERVAVNFLQRLCGIATLTRMYVEKTKGTKTKILDTRKTMPLLRHLDKYAVRMGGGFNHRAGLYDGVMIKDNHLALLGGAISDAVTKAKKVNPGFTIIVEVTSISQIEEAQKAGANRLLFDNMKDEKIAEALKKVKKGVEVEISGGVTLERIEALSKMGVHYISVGALTHSVKATDISFEVK